MHTAPPSILLASNTASQSRQYASYLEAQGYRVRCVYTGADVIAVLRENRADLVIADMELPGGDAIWLLDHLDVLEYAGKTIVLASDAPDARLQLVGNRASVITRPIGLAGLLQSVNTMFGQNETLPGALAGLDPEQHQIEEGPSERLERTSDFGGFIGTSRVMQDLYEKIYNAARSTATTFITGESGTGKEVCAQAIHKHSIRSARNFVPLNCSAIPRDLLESEIFGHVRGAFTGAVSDRDGAATMADGGTLFLDEIGDMDPNMQTKLLRFLQDGTFQRVGGNRLEKVDVRIICATNRDPHADVKSGRFREDLFYRLHVLPIIMPPLRARGDDVIDIAQTLLLRFAAEEGRRFKGFTNDAENALRNYSWPGNIRQLQNFIRHAVVMHDGVAITARMLPEELFLGSSQEHPADARPNDPVLLGDLDGSRRQARGMKGIVTPLHILERRAIEGAIRICAGNIPRAAAMLEVSPSTLYRKKAQWEGEAQSPGDTNMPFLPAEDVFHGR